MKPSIDRHEQMRQVLEAVPTDEYVRVSELRNRLPVDKPSGRSNAALNVHLIQLLYAGLVEVKYVTNPKDATEIVSTYRRRS